MLDVPVRLHELISWVIAAVSFTLLVRQWIHDPLTPMYMSLQGVLKALNTKAVFYFTQARKVSPRDAEGVSREELLSTLESASNDFNAFSQVVLGLMKAAKPGKDIPIDLLSYTTPAAPGSPLPQAGHNKEPSA